MLAVPNRIPDEPRLDKTWLPFALAGPGLVAVRLDAARSHYTCTQPYESEIAQVFVHFNNRNGPR